VWENLQALYGEYHHSACPFEGAVAMESAELALYGKDRRRILAQPQPYERNTSLDWELLALD
jgi:hypothetical protein